MNFFSFHIGDYMVHTRHLSLMEDLAYRRILDLYYTHEGTLPDSDAEVARRVGMREHVDDVNSVLLEFFPEGKNKRADEELERMRVKQEQQEIKNEHEADRMHRYRERRAEMFAILRTSGIVPAWDVPMKELQSLVDTCNAPATDLQREQNAPATAIPIPIPVPIPLVKEIGAAPPSVAPLPPDAFDGTNAQALNGKAVVMLAPGWELPQDWGEAAMALGFKVQETLHEGEKYRQYWTEGAGKGKRRTVKGWRQSWSNWLGKAAERRR